jgi:hypothetical protein
MGDIVDGTINTKTVKDVTVRKTGKLESDTILPADVILTLRAQPFRAVIAGEDVAGAALSANLVRTAMLGPDKPGNSCSLVQ